MTTFLADRDDMATGTLVVMVTHANKVAERDGATVSASETYTVTDATVKFDGGATSVADGDQVQLIGKFPMVRSHGKNACAPPVSPMPTFRVVVVHPAAS